jgi:hypothetical protein
MKDMEVDLIAWVSIGALEVGRELTAQLPPPPLPKGEGPIG